MASSIDVPARPRISSRFPPLGWNFAICSTSCLPMSLKSTTTRQAQGSVTMPSNETTTMPASQACLMAPLSASGEEALMTIAS